MNINPTENTQKADFSELQPRNQELALLVMELMDTMVKHNLSPFESSTVAANIISNIIAYYHDSVSPEAAGEVWGSTCLIIKTALEQHCGSKFGSVFTSKIVFEFNAVTKNITVVENIHK